MPKRRLLVCIETPPPLPPLPSVKIGFFRRGGAGRYTGVETSNLRSGVIFFLLLCFFGSIGKKFRTQITEIKGEGMIAG